MRGLKRCGAAFSAGLVAIKSVAACAGISWATAGFYLKVSPGHLQLHGRKEKEGLIPDTEVHFASKCIRKDKPLRSLRIHASSGEVCSRLVAAIRKFLLAISCVRKAGRIKEKPRD